MTESPIKTDAYKACVEYSKQQVQSVQIKLPEGKALLTLLKESNRVLMKKSNAKNNFDDLFGIVKATHSGSLEEIELALLEQGLERFNDGVIPAFLR